MLPSRMRQSINNPVEDVTGHGIMTLCNSYKQLNMIAVATGIDGVTVFITTSDITSLLSMSPSWIEEAKDSYTVLSMTILRFCHRFVMYECQAPTAFATDSPSAVCHSNWITGHFSCICANNLRRIDMTIFGEEGICIVIT